MKIRASAIGKIMTSSRSKGEVLSQTAKTYIQELALEHKYGIKKTINSRYIDKGLIVEDEAIQLCDRVLELGFVVKNDEYFENEFICGTPDVITDTLIVDVKSSWDLFTFPMFDDELPNKDYFWQMQGYMALTGKQSAIVSYCLIDTPLDIVQDEIRRASWAKKELEVSEATENEVRQQHEFSHIPEPKRVKAFLVEKDEQAINSIYEKVEEARKYYQQIIERI
jgi:hypothetical protein